MKTEIKIIFDEQFIEDIQTFQNSSELAQKVHEKSQIIKNFPRIGSEIFGNYRKITFEYKSEQYIFSYKFFDSEKKIKIYRIKNTRQNTFNSSEK